MNCMSNIKVLTSWHFLHMCHECRHNREREETSLAKKKIIFARNRQRNVAAETVFSLPPAVSYPGLFRQPKSLFLFSIGRRRTTGGEDRSPGPPGPPGPAGREGRPGGGVAPEGGGRPTPGGEIGRYCRVRTEVSNVHFISKVQCLPLKYFN